MGILDISSFGSMLYIHFRSLKDNVPHPDAGPVPSLIQAHGHAEHCQLQLMGDTFAIQFQYEDEENNLFLFWNWKTGRVHGVSNFPSPRLNVLN